MLAGCGSSQHRLCALMSLYLHMPCYNRRVVRLFVLSPCTVPISGGEAFIPVWASGCQLSAMTVASLVMGGCGLSHKRVGDGCKSTSLCGVWGLKTWQNSGYGMFNSCIRYHSNIAQLYCWFINTCKLIQAVQLQLHQYIIVCLANYLRDYYGCIYMYKMPVKQY